MAYAIQVQQVEAWVIGERQVAAVLAAAGADGVVMPDIVELRKAFDDGLVAPFTAPVDDRSVLLNALGVRGA